MIISSYGLLNLVLLLVTTALLLVGRYERKSRGKTILHATIMTTALVLTIASVLLIMVPSLNTASGAIVAGDDWRFAFMFVHHLIGLLALLMASVLAFSWLLRGRKPNSCLGRPKNKRLIMRTTFSLWLLSLIMGIALYVAFL
jgi:uncharacterized membrane protein YozB (DUF420 family)